MAADIKFGKLIPFESATQNMGINNPSGCDHDDSSHIKLTAKRPGIQPNKIILLVPNCNEKRPAIKFPDK